MKTSISKVASLVVVVALAIGGIVSGAGADNWDEFYQFKHSSALPGNLFGVGPGGQVGFDGAMLQNVPVAYTPCAGNWVLGGNSGSNSSSLHVGWGGANVNGTAFLGVGFGKPGHGIYVSNMETGDDWVSAYNVQVQVMRETFGHPAVAIGVQDIFNQRERMIGGHYGGRSVYVVITGKIGDPDKPTYMSLGWGGGRFNSSPFGGISLRVADQLAIVGEYDGFNTNAGVAYSLVSRPGERDWGAMGYLGWTNLERPVVGFAITKR